jgi:signal transduction histidine kinase
MRRKRGLQCNQKSAESVTAMMCAWGATIEEAGRPTARRWAARHGLLPSGDGARLLEELAITVMEEATEAAQSADSTGSRAARLGERFGECAYRAGTPLADIEHALEDLHGDLFELCREAVQRSGGSSSIAVETLELALRLERIVAETRRRATDAYAAALSEELRLRYRSLRHEMRNSLGTIRTSLALMNDESLPEAARQHPRLRDMLGRNAHFLDTLILDALSDAAASGVAARIGGAQIARGRLWDAPPPPSRDGGSVGEKAADLGRRHHRQDAQPGVL